MQLSILIPSLTSRAPMLAALLDNLNEQAAKCGMQSVVEILTEVDSGEQTIGTKRNKLLQRATGQYVCFHDDDDHPADEYVKMIMDCIKTGCDNCSMTGVIRWDGANPELFEHSIKYTEYKTNGPTHGIKYERYPNHLNVIRRDIAQQFTFPEINHGEDTDWATQIFKSGLLKNETTTNGVLYHYDYKTRK